MSQRKTSPKLEHFGIFICIVLIAVVFLSSIFEGRDVGWGKWVYDYQTLITGITAVGAAWLTIHQMKAIDRRQSDHAEAAMALTIRSDFLIVERLCTYAIPQLEECAKTWSKFVYFENMGDRQFFEEIHEHAMDITLSCSTLSKLINSKIFSDAQPFFNSRTHSEAESIRKALLELRSIDKYCCDWAFGDIQQSAREDFFYKHIDQSFYQPAEALADMLRKIERVRSELEALYQIYREVGTKSKLLQNI